MTVNFSNYFDVVLREDDAYAAFYGNRLTRRQFGIVRGTDVPNMFRQSTDPMGLEFVRL